MCNADNILSVLYKDIEHPYRCGGYEISVTLDNFINGLKQLMFNGYNLETFMCYDNSRYKEIIKNYENGRPSQMIKTYYLEMALIINAEIYYSSKYNKPCSYIHHSFSSTVADIEMKTIPYLLQEKSIINDNIIDGIDKFLESKSRYRALKSLDIYEDYYNYMYLLLALGIGNGAMFNIIKEGE